MIEDRLRETFDRVATGGPAEAGAFDRFQRHRRAHRSRRLAGATALVLVAALASAVAVPRLLSSSGQRRLYVTGAAGPERWMAAPLVAVAPLQGFEVKVPAGWEANATWKGIELRPTDPELRRHLAAPVQLVTGVLEEFYNPAPNAGKDGTYEDRTELPRTVMRRPEGRQSDGSFPGDNRWFRTDLQEGRWRTTQWHISWPYRCQPGVPCPAPLALRTLKVVYQVDSDGAAEIDGLAERLLRSARPIANAVKGQPHAPRPDCVDGRSMVLRRRDRRLAGLRPRPARWPTSGGGPGPPPTWCPAPSGARSGSSCSTGSGRPARRAGQRRHRDLGGRPARGQEHLHGARQHRAQAEVAQLVRLRGPDLDALDRRARPRHSVPGHRAPLHRPLQAVAAHGGAHPPLADR